MILVSDFETTGEKNFEQDGYVRVWAWHIRELLAGGEVAKGINLDDCMVVLMSTDNTCYFHNLRFDGVFIVDWLLNNGYSYIERCKKREPKTFSTLISDSEQWYKIEVISPQGNRLEIYDSFKKIPQKAEKIAIDYQLNTVKGSIDYECYRPVGYTPTPEEWEYIANDTYIIREALKAQIQNGYDSMTIGADCMKVYKETIGKKNFKYLFPELSLECDTFCRKSYKGGYVYCNPKHVNKVINNVMALDVNSLYPFVMKEYKYPCGLPKYAIGRGIEEGYIQHIKVCFRIKDGYLPTIQIKKSMMWSDNEYIIECVDEPVDLWLTKPDLELFIEHYNILYIEYIDRYVFDMQEGLFDEYIDYFYELKRNPPTRPKSRLLSYF